MTPLNAIWIIATTALATVFALAGIAIAADAVRSWHRTLGTTLARQRHAHRSRLRHRRAAGPALGRAEHRLRRGAGLLRPPHVDAPVGSRERLSAMLAATSSAACVLTPALLG